LTEERAAWKAVSTAREKRPMTMVSAVKACMVRGEPICSEA
jgi:hypothetical protein